MKRRVVVALLTVAAVSAAAPIELHVSPVGDDSNPGTREKPLATPVGARDALRRTRAAVADAHERVPPAVVVFEDGVYSLSEPVKLDARDGSNVTWRAANRGKAVGFVNVFAYVIGSFAPVVFGFISHRWNVRGFEVGFAALGALLVLAAAMMAYSYFRLFKRYKVEKG